jgi:predicted transcriptional regulator
MSTISLRLPDSLHERARELAEKENISINQLVTLALAEKISALMTEDYLGERARRASKVKFRKAMSKVADVEPAQEDRL